MDAPPTVSFLSDYGRADEFVGVCHGVMLRIEPRLRIIDITHDIPPHDVRAGALALARAVQYLPEGVVLGVVDPGVGTDRRPIAVGVEGGFFVGPDNGLLAPAVAMAGGATAGVVLTSEHHRLPAPGATFDGRDVFAPAAAALASGVDLGELGDAIDPLSLQPGLLPLTRVEAGAVHGEVLWIDRFGNVQLNIDPEELRSLGLEVGGVAEVRIGESTRPLRWVEAYGAARSGEAVLLVDSYGLVSVAPNQGSAADELGIRPAQA
ncbi:MAG: SAM-dependent chlorinase/fluorinase [Actinobacteria bacterium]|nr:SAM-dependent chlorinase/fluorinase [Actinomycetota bacterium]